MRAMTAVESPRSIFLRWERLRVFYNALLAAVTVVILLLLRDELVFPDPLTVAATLFAGAVLANVCFTAAPIVEAYARWLGLRTRALTPGLFAAGVLVSIPLVLLFLLAAFRWTIG
jgi:hypothetical protein